MLVLFFNESLELMIPFAIVTVVLVIVDLYFGWEAARLKYAKDAKSERVRASTALRRTVNKLVEYTCWVVLASTLAVAFHKDWIHTAMMAIVITNEVISIIDNYFYCHGKKVTGIWQFVFRAVGDKFNVDTSDINVEDLEK